VATLTLLALTAGSKALLAEARTPPLPPTARLETFLRRAGAEVLTPDHAGRAAPLWAGWSFQIHGCAARAFPQVMDGALDSLLRRRIAPSDALAFVYRGEVSPAPPGSGRRIGYLAERAAQSLRLEAPSDGFYVALIYPPSCPAARDLPWRSL
jgi:hypothetical protein